MNNEIRKGSIYKDGEKHFLIKNSLNKEQNEEKLSFTCHTIIEKSFEQKGVSEKDKTKILPNKSNELDKKNLVIPDTKLCKENLKTILNIEKLEKNNENSKNEFNFKIISSYREKMNLGEKDFNAEKLNLSKNKNSSSKLDTSSFIEINAPSPCESNKSSKNIGSEDFTYENMSIISDQKNSDNNSDKNLDENISLISEGNFKKIQCNLYYKNNPFLQYNNQEPQLVLDVPTKSLKMNGKQYVEKLAQDGESLLLSAGKAYNEGRDLLREQRIVDALEEFVIGNNILNYYL